MVSELMQQIQSLFLAMEEWSTSCPEKWPLNQPECVHVYPTQYYVTVAALM